MTGLANFEPSMGGKWLQILREIAPYLTKVRVRRFAGTQARILANIADNAVSVGIKVFDCPVHDQPELQAAIGAFGDAQDVG